MNKIIKYSLIGFVCVMGFSIIGQSNKEKNAVAKAMQDENEKAQRVKNVAEWNAADARTKKVILAEGFNSFVPFDCGGGPGLTKSGGFYQIKQSLRDPSSFEFIDFVKRGSGLKIEGGVRYRAKNGFGGFSIETAWCSYKWNIENRRYE